MKKLVENVILQASGYNLDDLKDVENSADVKNKIYDFREASEGVSGFIYYSETCQFWRENKDLIKGLAFDMMESLGISDLGFASFVQSFNCLKDMYTVREVEADLYEASPDEAEKPCDVENALAWFALEEVFFRLKDLIYDEPEKSLFDIIEENFND